MTFRLETSRRAQADINGHVAFIQRRSSAISAARWHDGLLRRVRGLAERPEVWPIADEAAEVGLELREVLYRRYRYVYRILYRIDGNVVRIHRIRSAAQDRLTPDDL